MCFWFSTVRDGRDEFRNMPEISSETAVLSSRADVPK